MIEKLSICVLCFFKPPCNICNFEHKKVIKELHERDDVSSTKGFKPKSTRAKTEVI